MGFKSFLGLSIALAKTEFKLRNEGSYLGILWYLLNPLLMFLLLFLVFADRLGSGIPHYPLYLLLGIILFNFFQQAATQATKQIITNNVLIKSVHFPYAALIGGGVLKTIFSHVFEMLVFTAFLIFFGVSIKAILFYPIILVFFCCFTLGISLFLSSVAVYFMDLENIWVFVSRLLWLATPIFYAIEGQTRLFYFNLLNPLYYFITASRAILIYQRQPQAFILFGIIIGSLISLSLGFVVFHKLKNKFADML